MSPPPELPYPLVQAQIALYYGIGSLSLIINSVTLVIILRNSPMLAGEVKTLAVCFQVACLVQNAFITLLFNPVLYLHVAGGYCVGLLCFFVPYHFLAV
ncbi:hypothetical protein PFISCL1PPCAC_13249, partial [Pristionchus fissidentatus]